MPGLLFTMPALVLGAAAWIFGIRRRHGARPRPLSVVVAAATLCSVASGALLFCFAGACSRYITELMAGASAVIAIGYLALPAILPPGTPGRVVGTLARLSVLWSFAAVWLCSLEIHQIAHETHRHFYNATATLLNYPSHWFAERSGQKFGPISFDLHLPEKFAPGSTAILVTGHPSRLTQLIVERIAPDQARLWLLTDARVALVTPPFNHGHRPLRLELHAPWLYPPAAHPYWDRFADTGQRTALQSRIKLVLPEMTVETETVQRDNPTRFEPFLQTAPNPDRPADPWIENATRLEPNASFDPKSSAASSGPTEPPKQ